MKKAMRILLALAVIVTALAGCKAKPETPTTAPASGDTTASAVQTTQTTTAAATQPAEETTEEPTEDTTEPAEDTTEAKEDGLSSKLMKGCWYLFDDKNRCVYAMSFDKNGGGKMAYFDEYNIDYYDVQYYKGDLSYSLSGDTLTVTGMPQEAPVKKLTLTVSGDTLLDGKTELTHKNKLTLETAVNHFK